MYFRKILLLTIPLIILNFRLLGNSSNSENPVAQVIYLVGNTGNNKAQDDLHVLRGMARELASEKDSSTVLFLGNLFRKKLFTQGLNLPEQNLDDLNVIRVLKDIDKYANDVFVNPGQFEWTLSNQSGFHCTMAYEYLIEKFLFKGNSFLPDKGCPGPEEIELDNNTILLFIDTQWWLNQEIWNREWKNQECDIESPGDMLLLLKDAINRNEGKHIIVVGHHPIRSYGMHGGYFPGYIHLTPPLFGSLHVAYKKLVGYSDDFANPSYKSLIRGLNAIFEGNQDIIYVSAHESSLQYIRADNVFQIISGTGSETKYVRESKVAFTKSVPGYMKLKLYENHEVWLESWKVNEDLSGEKIYEKMLYKLDPSQFVQSDYSMKKLEGETVPIQASISYGLPKKRPGLMGNNYRAEWLQVVQDIEYLDLGTVYGGLKVIKRGGGMQTKSLRFENEEGRQYVIRSVEKYPEAAVPAAFKNTIASDLIKDFISSSHPYAAIAIPPMADAVGVYHTNPQIIYIPNEPKLGIYEEEFGGALYLFEERPMSKQRKLVSFGNAKDIISTDKMIKKRLDNNEIHVDQLFTLRSRLFDMWIGDWDRHEDQWRWAEFDMGKGKDKMYRPIPRDRDQAFFYNDGFIIRVGTRPPGLSKFQGFDYTVRDIKGFNFNARYFDRSFLTEPEWKDWLETIDYLKENLTNEVIYQGISSFPQEIYKHSGDLIMEKLKKRRDDLEDYARNYYEFLSKEVTVVGSNEKEWFNVERISDTETKVTVWDLKQKTNEPDFKMYERVFENGITNEVRLFGLGDDDVFTVNGNVNNSVKLRVIGGYGNDRIEDKSSVKGWYKNTIVYDTKGGIEIVGGSEIKDKTSNKIGINYYDRTAFQYDFWTPLVYVDLSPDDGLFITADFNVYKYGFRKDPYKWLQKYSIRYSPSVNSWKFKYEGDYIDVIGNWDVNVAVNLFYPRYTDYYYGLGNETVIDEQDHNEQYYHFKFSSIEIVPLLRKDFNNRNHYLEIGPYINFYRLNETDEDRKFLDDFPGSDNHDLVTYAGALAAYTLNTRNSDHYPLYGMYWRSTVAPIIDTSNDSIFFTKLTTDFSFYQSTGGSLNTTFAFRAGGAFNFGNYMFYQANDLGGKSNLRGHRRMRFSGDHTLFVNLEARMRLFRFSMPLFPGSFGIYGFFDTGRVWYKDENGIDPSTESGESNTWHAGYGGGIWIAPLRRYVFSLDVSNSIWDKQMLVFFRYGFFF